jgi:hypothetical protein
VGQQIRAFLCSCSAQEWESPAMSVVAVIPAGAVPSIIAVMMRGDTKASRASGQADVGRGVTNRPRTINVIGHHQPPFMRSSSQATSAH